MIAARFVDGIEYPRRCRGLREGGPPGLGAEEVAIAGASIAIGARAGGATRSRRTIRGWNRIPTAMPWATGGRPSGPWCGGGRVCGSFHRDRRSCRRRDSQSPRDSWMVSNTHGDAVGYGRAALRALVRRRSRLRELPSRSALVPAARLAVAARFVDGIEYPRRCRGLREGGPPGLGAEAVAIAGASIAIGARAGGATRSRRTIRGWNRIPTAMPWATGGRPSGPWCGGGRDCGSFHRDRRSCRRRDSQSPRDSWMVSNTHGDAVGYGRAALRALVRRRSRLQRAVMRPQMARRCVAATAPLP